MRIIGENGRKDLARVYLAEMKNGLMVEFVDSCDPAVGGRDKKWVIVVSSQFGCPVGCLTCDAGGDFRGNLNHTEIIGQIKKVFEKYPEHDPNNCPKLKIQFARMGEPALNDAVIDVIHWLADNHPRAMPCVATIAPAGRGLWFESFLNASQRFSNVQLQFSINTTDMEMRDRLIPFPKMSWPEIAVYGQRFCRPGSRKPSLNFALSPGISVEAGRILDYFDPGIFAVKLTPLNPTATAMENCLQSITEITLAQQMVEQKAAEFSELGYEVIRSVGNMEENAIGSNCGQMVRKFKADISEYDKTHA
jgi:23S rRNA (adenine2503-C2)-methyltransferase